MSATESAPVLVNILPTNEHGEQLNVSPYAGLRSRILLRSTLGTVAYNPGNTSLSPTEEQVNNLLTNPDFSDFLQDADVVSTYESEQFWAGLNKDDFADYDLDTHEGRVDLWSHKLWRNAEAHEDQMRFIIDKLKGNVIGIAGTTAKDIGWSLYRTFKFDDRLPAGQKQKSSQEFFNTIKGLYDGGNLTAADNKQVVWLAKWLYGEKAAGEMISQGIFVQQELKTDEGKQDIKQSLLEQDPQGKTRCNNLQQPEQDILTEWNKGLNNASTAIKNRVRVLHQGQAEEDNTTPPLRLGRTRRRTQNRTDTDPLTTDIPEEDTWDVNDVETMLRQAVDNLKAGPDADQAETEAPIPQLEIKNGNEAHWILTNPQQFIQRGLNIDKSKDDAKFYVYLEKGSLELYNKLKDSIRDGSQDDYENVVEKLHYLLTRDEQSLSKDGFSTKTGSRARMVSIKQEAVHLLRTAIEDAEGKEMFLQALTEQPQFLEIFEVNLDPTIYSITGDKEASSRMDGLVDILDQLSSTEQHKNTLRDLLENSAVAGILQGLAAADKKIGIGTLGVPIKIHVDQDAIQNLINKLNLNEVTVIPRYIQNPDTPASFDVPEYLETIKNDVEGSANPLYFRLSPVDLQHILLSSSEVRGILFEDLKIEFIPAGKNEKNLSITGQVNHGGQNHRINFVLSNSSRENHLYIAQYQIGLLGGSGGPTIDGVTYDYAGDLINMWFKANVSPDLDVIGSSLDEDSEEIVFKIEKTTPSVISPQQLDEVIRTSPDLGQTLFDVKNELKMIIKKIVDNTTSSEESKSLLLAVNELLLYEPSTENPDYSFIQDSIIGYLSDEVQTYPDSLKQIIALYGSNPKLIDGLANALTIFRYSKYDADKYRTYRTLEFISYLLEDMSDDPDHESVQQNQDHLRELLETQGLTRQLREITERDAYTKNQDFARFLLMKLGVDKQDTRPQPVHDSEFQRDTEAIVRERIEYLSKELNVSSVKKEEFNSALIGNITNTVLETLRETVSEDEALRIINNVTMTLVRNSVLLRECLNDTPIEIDPMYYNVAYQAVNSVRIVKDMRAPHVKAALRFFTRNSDIRREISRDINKIKTYIYIFHLLDGYK